MERSAETESPALQESLDGTDATERTEPLDTPVPRVPLVFLDSPVSEEERETRVSPPSDTLELLERRFAYQNDL